MLPWILGAAAVGLATWALSGDDDSSSSNDRYDREQEARKRAREAKKEQIKQDIEAFTESEKKRIRQKYNAQIEFSENDSLRIVKEDESLGNKINALEGEQDELKELIAQLKEEQNATNQ